MKPYWFHTRKHTWTAEGRLIVAVIVLGSIGIVVLCCRRLDFSHRADIHLDRWFETQGTSARGNYHKEMEIKYRRAARYPWLPIVPDPPEPE